MARMAWTAVMVLGLGCGPTLADPGDGGTTGASASGSPSTTESATTNTNSPPDPSLPTTVDPDPTIDPDPTVDPDSSTDPTDDTATSLSFIQGDISCFTHCTQIECDIWAQDCPRGEKCMPWANDGGNAWNNLRCTPLAENPGQPGDPCTVEGSGVSGIDDCALGVMCWDVDPETNTGTCVAMCTGSEADPQCAAACDRCVIANDGVLILCLPLCHPADGACPEGQACVPFEDAFTCVPSGTTVGLGEVCDVDACADGLRCVPGAALPSCDGASCCTPWCVPGGVDPCEAQVPTTSCLPLGVGEVPGCVAPIGYCALPA